MALEVKKKNSRCAATAIWLVSWSLIMVYNVSLAERILKDQKPEAFAATERHGVMISIFDFFWKDGGPSNDRVWPVSLSNMFSYHESIVCTVFLFIYLFHDHCMMLF